jgi:tetratricopeptide (TPR) repeat protein
MGQMDKEEIAEKLRNQALEIQGTNPQGALILLQNVMREYKDTYTVINLVCDDVIQLAKHLKQYDEAIEACHESIELRPDYRESFLDEIKACHLDKQGKQIEATDVRLASARKPGPFFVGNPIEYYPYYTTLRYFADIYANLGAHDKAWSLYNEAVINAVRDGQSPHSIRQSMASLLIDENKILQAIEILLVGIYEANKWKKVVPKAIISDLNKALKVVGITEKGFAQELTDSVLVNGHEKTFQRIRDYFQNG